MCLCYVIFAGDYVLGQQDGQWGLVRLTAASTLSPFSVYAISTAKNAFLPFTGDALTGISDNRTAHEHTGATFNLKGQRVSSPKRGLYIIDGRKLFIK